MSLRRKIQDYICRPSEPAPPDPLERFRGAPAKLLTDFDILAQGQGLLATMQTGLPLDGSGNPIPWFTYPAIEYLNQFDLSGKKIFEYGSGNSTAYWARRGAEVWAVDHDQKWFDKMTDSLSTGQTLYYADTEQDYSAAIARPGILFDIVVIDGTFRTACVEPGIAHLRPGGFIIFDNAERDVQVGEMLRQKGLFEVDFNGFGPINDYTWTTAIFLSGAGITGFKIAAPRPVGGNFGP
jgi:hypothetical protein